MKLLFGICALLFVSNGPFAEATTVSDSANATNGYIALPPLSPGPIDQQWKEIVSAGVSYKKQIAGTLIVEGYIEVQSHTYTTPIFCRLSPHSFLGRPIDPAQTVLEIFVGGPSNQGTNPQPISAQTGVHRLMNVKITQGQAGAAMYSIDCRQQVSGNSPVNVYANLKLRFTSND